ncbi:type II toxin-antitoxin system Phd/YefM family antitoxin [Sinanaerobacter sp. ZZT-01]|uniref:type II toxin-antitoxin system Phd/YefM family antitoxin n=1 Tax=Sinanaerobacter sp. ZZT-01 TaxID=3111540 RepID=UPI002D78BCC5|nr:type II toxin-antitoxin system Phd/YefM family antitoxin [Sinanaerobacter sp. ZZT-01]WRR93280.1 type II toxin-antitoxin system Phd/YefM family antitoxin [Sinanaerobacter sp. ZZT-01]
MTSTNITNFRKNVFKYMSQAIQYNDVINVNTKEGNAIIISEDDYNSLMATLSLSSVPGLIESIKAGEKESIENMVDADEVEW